MCLYDTVYSKCIYIYSFKQLSHVYKNKHIVYSYYPPFVISAFFLQWFFLCSPKKMEYFWYLKKKHGNTTFTSPKNLETSSFPKALTPFSDDIACSYNGTVRRLEDPEDTDDDTVRRLAAACDSNSVQVGVGKGIRGRRFTSKKGETHRKTMLIFRWTRCFLPISTKNLPETTVGSPENWMVWEMIIVSCSFLGRCFGLFSRASC